MENGSRPTQEFRREAVRLALTSGLTHRSYIYPAEFAQVYFADLDVLLGVRVANA